MRYNNYCKNKLFVLCGDFVRIKLNLTESPQNIQVTKAKRLTRQQIVDYMWLARRSREYVKFMLDNNYYIMVIFNRDNSVQLLSNIKTEPTFMKELYWLDKYGYDQGKWSYFIWYWLDRFSNKNMRNL